ncbi:uncharacterized protein LOC116810224, partial [Hylobates moloch]|uniref:uncharacterized protein LOC116810224 n=1 Tax=Hylobates moloch TaxID=81572 RepID=UPI0026771D59
LSPRPSLTLPQPWHYTSLALAFALLSLWPGSGPALHKPCSALRIPAWAQPWSYHIPGPNRTLVLALTLPWPSLGPSLVVPCPSMPWPCPYPALSLHCSCPALALSWPWPCLLPGLALAMPLPDSRPTESMKWTWTWLAILCPGPILSPPCSGPVLALALLLVLPLLWPCPVFGHALCHSSPALPWPWPYHGLLLPRPGPTLVFSTLALLFPGLSLPWPCPALVFPCPGLALALALPCPSLGSALALPLLWIFSGSAFSLALPLLWPCPWPSLDPGPGPDNSQALPWPCLGPVLS